MQTEPVWTPILLEADNFLRSEVPRLMSGMTVPYIMNDLIDNNMVEDEDDIGLLFGTFDWEAAADYCRCRAGRGANLAFRNVSNELMQDGSYFCRQ